MGNTHAFGHRIPALATACVASGAVALLAMAGQNCSFLDIQAKEGETLVVDDSKIEFELKASSIGILCERDYSSDGDSLWALSRIVLYVAMAIGGTTTALAWAVSTFLPPTERNWTILSFMSAVVAVVQVPIFLMFEAEPCTDFQEQQTCQLSTGSYFLIASIVCWVLVTFMTQYLDPPLWALELNAWRVSKPRGEAAMEVDENHEEDVASPVERQSFLQRVRKWSERRRRRAKPDSLLNAQTESISCEGDVVPDQDSYYANSNNSRLVLKVLPNGRLVGDEAKSDGSFGDLDSIVKLAEEGKLGEQPVPPSPEKESEPDVAFRNFGEATTRAPEPRNESSHAVVIMDTKQLSAPELVVMRNGIEHVQPYEDAKEPKEQQAIENNHDGLPLLPDKKEEEDDEDANGRKRRGKLSGIRAASRRMKREARRRMKQNSGYSLLDEEDIESSFPLPPIEVTINVSDDAGKIRTGNVSTTNEKQLLDDWNALHGHVETSQPHSSREASLSHESDPDVAYYSSDDDSSTSSISLPPALAIGPEDEDIGSLLSSGSGSGSGSSSVPKSSTPPRPSPRSNKRPPPTRRIKFSSNNSVSTPVSLLQMTIYEETDDELREFLTSDEEEETERKTPSDTVPESIFRERPTPPDSSPAIALSYSAPQLGASGRRSFKLRSQRRSESKSLSEIEGRLLRRKRIAYQRLSSSKKRSSDKRKSRGRFPATSASRQSPQSSKENIRSPPTPDGTPSTKPSAMDGKISSKSLLDTDSSQSVRIVAHVSGAPVSPGLRTFSQDSNVSNSQSAVATAGSDTNLNTSLERKQHNTAHSYIPWHSSRIEDRGPASDSDNDGAFSLKSRNKSMSLPRTARVTPVASSATSAVENRSRKKERALRGGIHDASALDASSSDSSDNGNSKRMSLQDRARRARIQRLQQETKDSGTDASERSLSDSRRDLPGSEDYSYVIDTLDLHFAEWRRPYGAEYGPDEASL